MSTEEGYDEDGQPVEEGDHGNISPSGDESLGGMAIQVGSGPADSDEFAVHDMPEEQLRD